jgi:hypothetical protein
MLEMNIKKSNGSRIVRLEQLQGFPNIIIFLIHFLWLPMKEHLIYGDTISTFK